MRRTYLDRSGLWQVGREGEGDGRGAGQAKVWMGRASALFIIRMGRNERKSTVQLLWLVNEPSTIEREKTALNCQSRPSCVECTAITGRGVNLGEGPLLTLAQHVPRNQSG